MEENLCDTSILNLIEFSKALKFNLKIRYPSRSDYELALKFSIELAGKSRPVSAIDMIIAATAINNNLTLITKDKHFLSIRELENRFKVEIE